MSQLPSGKQLPDDFNVLIEIPAYSSPVKYEFDKENHILVVDRFMATCMQYPCNYGFIPGTLSEDGDPADVLVITPHPLQHGTLIRCRPVGLLRMTDEAGPDSKIIALPHEKLTRLYNNIKDVQDLPELLLQQIKHFFEHYKDLEAGKWVKVESFEGLDAARKEISKSADRA